MSRLSVKSWIPRAPWGPPSDSAPPTYPVVRAVREPRVLGAVAGPPALVTPPMPSPVPVTGPLTVGEGWKSLPVSPNDPALKSLMTAADIEIVQALHENDQRYGAHEEVPVLVLRAMAAFAAVQGGRVLNALFDQPRSVVSKGGVDLVTDADYASQEVVVRCLRLVFADDRIIAEEDSTGPDSESPDPSVRRTWFADPLDGTKNYQKKRHGFAVNVGAVDNRQLTAAATYDPSAQELMVSAKGEGTLLNGKAVRCNDGPEPSLANPANDALVEYNLPLDAYQRPVPVDDRYSLIENSLRQRVNRISHVNSAALALLNLACGRADGVVLEKVHAWDLVGLLHVEEAGGAGATFGGATGVHVLTSGNVVAASRANQPLLLKLVAP